MSKFGQLTYPEISNQHEAIQKAWELVGKQKEWAKQHLANPKYKEVVFIGSGSSYYQAQTMAATYKAWSGRPASALPSSELYLFQQSAVAKHEPVLVVGVSRSGESSEVVLALEAAAKVDGWDICGITCHEDSSMAKMSPCLVSEAGKEKSTVMTKSFSSMTFMMQAAIAYAFGADKALADLKQTVELAGETVKKADSFAKTFVQEHDFKKMIYLGMGSYFGLAQEACLKLKEMSYVWTESFGTLEFRHGPKSIIEKGSLICLFLSEQAREHEIKVAKEMQAYGATVWVITARKGDDIDFADAVFETGGENLSDEARAVLNLPAVQYFGYYTALKLDVDPDNPRNLTQVVII